MIEECIPFSFIDKEIDVMENELEYELYENEDDEDSTKLSHQIEALKELKKRWLNVNR